MEDLNQYTQDRLVGSEPGFSTLGGFNVKSVIGDEDRKLVSNTLHQPFRWVCQVLAIRGSGPNRRIGVGSGFVIGQRSILTAGHNLWVDDAPAQEFYIYLGLNGDRDAPPFGAYVTRKSEAHPRYISNRDPRFDAAFLVLDRSISSHPSVPSYGSLRWSPVDPTLLKDVLGIVSGYPRHEPHHNGHDDAPIHDRQWWSSGMLQYADGRLFYQADTTQGQSGSPLLVAMTDPASGTTVSTAVGVHIKGVEDAEANSAAPFGPELAKFVADGLRKYEPQSIA